MGGTPSSGPLRRQLPTDRPPMLCETLRPHCTNILSVCPQRRTLPRAPRARSERGRLEAVGGGAGPLGRATPVGRRRRGGGGSRGSASLRRRQRPLLWGKWLRLRLLRLLLLLLRLPPRELLCAEAVHLRSTLPAHAHLDPAVGQLDHLACLGSGVREGQLQAHKVNFTHTRCGGAKPKATLASPRLDDRGPTA